MVMKIKQQIIMFLLIVTFGSAVNDLFSQNINSKPTRQSSFEAFSKENYEQAYNEFTELLKIYPKDPLYNYYSAVCLVKLKRNPDKAVILLKLALEGAVGVKALPPDGYFFLGRAHQMAGQFQEAIESYETYTEVVGRKTAKGSGVPEFIKQCDERKGALTESDTKPAELVENTKVDSSKVVRPPEKEVVIQPVKETAVQQPVKEEPVNLPVKQEVVMPPVKNEVSAQNNLPANYEKLVDQALEFQYYADSLNSLVAQQKKELDQLPDKNKASLRVKISENERTALSYQKSADKKFSEANAALNPVHEAAKKADSVPQPEKKVIKDSVKLAKNDVIRKSNKLSDSVKTIIPVSVNRVELFTIFNVLPKPTDPKAKIIVDPEVPDGLIYRIQIGVYRNPVTAENFKGINPIYGFKIPETDKTVFYAGMFRKAADANKALATVKAKGFKDSFIVALTGTKKVSADRAAIMEKEWGKKPFVIIENVNSKSATDTMPPALSYKVEVIRSPKPLKDDVAEGIKKIAGSRTLIIQPIGDGNTSYLISKFITFESAAEYADLLKRNGYNEARVIAFLGNNEIPVETAKQLFENVK
jgi:hypothetical protein